MATATMTNSKPIPFSGPMIRALLAGTKSQTRRAVKPQPAPGQSVWPCGWTATGWALGEDPACVEPAGCFCRPVRCPYGAEGDTLWCRETFATTNAKDHGWGNPIYRATFGAAMKPVCEGFTPWKSPIHMPRWASRLTLEIESVRVERLNAISEEDAVAEGFEVQVGGGTGPGPGFKWDGPAYWDGFSLHSDGISGKTYHAPNRAGVCCCDVGRREALTPARCAFRHLWDKINGPGSWDLNPWVWAIGFRRLP